MDKLGPIYQQLSEIVKYDDNEEVISTERQDTKENQISGHHYDIEPDTEIANQDDDFFSHYDGSFIIREAEIQPTPVMQQKTRESETKNESSNNAQLKSKTNSIKSEPHATQQDSKASPLLNASVPATLNKQVTKRPDVEWAFAEVKAQHLSKLQHDICQGLHKTLQTDINTDLPISVYIAGLSQFIQEVSGDLSKAQQGALWECVSWLNHAAQCTIPKDCISMSRLALQFNIKYQYNESSDEYTMTTTPQYFKYAAFFGVARSASCLHLGVYDHFSEKYARDVCRIINELGFKSAVELAAGRGQQTACFQAIKQNVAETTDPIINPRPYPTVTITAKDGKTSVLDRERAKKNTTLYLACHPVKGMWSTLFENTEYPFVVLTVGPEASGFLRDANKFLSYKTESASIDINLKHYSKLNNADKVQLLFFNTSAQKAQKLVRQLSPKYAKVDDLRCYK
ncbi:hypothetical protein JQC92_01190 [Shewanella sp. 202IG2-18]|uniref:hypothetical protein n=1 Tax=Parashewanella hymeniacidonis TaxID=2807618 RepID=UPI001961D5C6|nr:hypothetical protein [Parashewanella hymeniacidonis]MBM7070657.1 hypothetical protein [Parashewanella hymeniacidonis]